MENILEESEEDLTKKPGANVGKDVDLGKTQNKYESRGESLEIQDEGNPQVSEVETAKSKVDSEGEQKAGYSPAPIPPPPFVHSTSADRLPALEAMCMAWGGAICVAVHVRLETEIASVYEQVKQMQARVEEQSGCRMFLMAVLPVVKIFVTCGFGAYLGHPSVNILTEDGRKFLNKLVVVAFTPAFVFTKLARSVSWENICNWWYMPFNIGLCFVCGAAMGLLVLKYTTIPPHLRNLILACCAAGNTGNVPLVLVPAICEEDGNPFGRTVSCSRDAEAYVSYGMWKMVFGEMR